MKHEAPGDVADYADGAPFDRITYLEAKLILKPNQFTSVRSFRDFGRIVRGPRPRAVLASSRIRPRISAAALGLVSFS